VSDPRPPILKREDLPAGRKEKSENFYRGGKNLLFAGGTRPKGEGGERFPSGKGRKEKKQGIQHPKKGTFLALKRGPSLDGGGKGGCDFNSPVWEKESFLTSGGFLQAKRKKGDFYGQKKKAGGPARGILNISKERGGGKQKVCQGVGDEKRFPKGGKKGKARCKGHAHRDLFSCIFYGCAPERKNRILGGEGRETALVSKYTEKKET